jgi:biopolymer transport protein TolQ
MLPHVAWMQVEGMGSPMELLRNANAVTIGVLAFLVLLSLVSWVVMISAWLEIGRAERAGTKLMSEVERATRLEQAASVVKTAKPSAFTRLFRRATQYVSEIGGLNLRVREQEMGESSAPTAATLTGSQIETLHLLLDTDAANERDRLGRLLPWLAIIASVSPLTGLLGTVLGVIDSFMGIAQKGSGNLAAVAPGVAEALIATAVSLAVAIPATFGYNIFASRLNRVDAKLESFSTTLIALLVREGRI